MKFLILFSLCLVAFVRSQDDLNDPEVGPDPEIGPDPEVGPDPEIGPGPEVVPEPEVVPGPEIVPNPPHGEVEDEHADDPVEGPTHSSALFNERLDQIIKDTIAKNHAEIVPYKIRDQKTGFWHKVGPLNLTGEAGFVNNTLDGLVNVRRVDDAYLGRTKWGNVEMTLSLQVGPLELNTNGFARFLGIGPRVSYKITAAHVDAAAVLHFNGRTEKVAVKSFTVNEILGLSFKITKSPGFITPIVANQIIKGGIAIFNPLIRKAVTRTGAVVLDRLIMDSEFVKDVMLEANKL